MSRKSILAILVILLLVTASLLGLPRMVRRIEEQTESAPVVVTWTPDPFLSGE